MNIVSSTLKIYITPYFHDHEYERKSSFINKLTVNKTGPKAKVWIIVAKNIDVGQKEAPFGVLE